MGDLSKHFSREEFRCKGCRYAGACGNVDHATVDAAVLGVLEVVREHFKSPVRITSGHRCSDHNKAVGGSPRSKHLTGRAADFSVDGVDPLKVAEFLRNWRGGLGTYWTFTHVDSRRDHIRWTDRKH